MTRKTSRRRLAFAVGRASSALGGSSWVGRAALLSLMLICVPANGAEPGKGELWRGVSKIRGRATIEDNSGRNDRTSFSHTTAEETTHVQVDFTMERRRPKPPEEQPLPTGLPPQLIEMMRAQKVAMASDDIPSRDLFWDADASTIKIVGQTFGTHDHAFFPREQRYTTRADFGGPVLFPDSFTLELNTETGAWQLVTPGRLREKYRRVTTGTELNVSTKESRVIDEAGETDGFLDAVFDGTLSGKPVAVHGTVKVEQGPTPDNPTGWSRKIGRLDFWPEFVDVEVEVTIKAYAGWRPEGSIAKPGAPGNRLIARGTLLPKAGARVEDLPKMKKFRFELLETSREPGVCLNWPLKAKDEDFDLRLAVAPGFQGQLSGKDQAISMTEALIDEKGHPFAETQIDSYDFGGRATLQVICELDDGREIVGVMKSDGGEEVLVPLPKLKGSDWIAESWRKKHDVENLPAQDDDEKVEGQNDNGDGFTLYEEYRGWVEQGKRLEGDPKKKDFFVHNTIGADAKSGIALFERVSKLRVHALLRASEIVMLPMVYLEAEANAQGERIMNLNHRDGPHRVDQHAVVMINTNGYGSRGGGSDAVRNNDQTSPAFRPGKVQAIHIEERGRTNGIFSQHVSTAEYNLSERDAAFAYDRGVAHELLHSVGVDHHGEGEESRTFYFQGAGDPMNTAHRPRFVPYMPSAGDDFGKRVWGKPAVWSDFDRGQTITLRWEDTKEDVAQSMSADFERELTAERNDPLYERDGSEQAAKYPQYGKDAAFWSEMAIYTSVAGGATKRGILNTEAHRFDRSVTIGREHQADSGNELCLMRYYFATAYPVDAAETAFYLVRPGMNRAGRELCRSPEGTGANAASHDPKSRFGDSAAGRGNCFSYICPNDGIPPRRL